MVGARSSRAFFAFTKNTFFVFSRLQIEPRQEDSFGRSAVRMLQEQELRVLTVLRIAHGALLLPHCHVGLSHTSTSTGGTALLAKPSLYRPSLAYAGVVARVSLGGIVDQIPDGDKALRFDGICRRLEPERVDGKAVASREHGRVQNVEAAVREQ